MGKVFKHPRRHIPGRKFDFQVPSISDNRIFDDLALIQSSTVPTTTLPITNAQQGDIPVWNSVLQAYVPSNHIDIPFGFGTSPLSGVQVSILPASGLAGLLVNGTVAISGSTEIVGNVQLDNSLTVVQNATIDNNLIVNNNGIISGLLGVGITPTHRFHAIDGTVETWFDNIVDNLAGATGWHINRPSTSNTPHIINWYIDHNYLWGMGVDSATDTTSGDFIVINDQFTLFNGVGGSDCLRFSPGNASAQGIKGIFGGPVGSPRSQPQLFTFQGSANLCPLGTITSSDNSSVNTINMTRATTGTHCIRLNFNNDWIYGVDIGFTNDIAFTWFAAVGGTRLYLSNTSLVNYGTFACSGTSLFQGALTAGVITTNGLLTATANILDTGNLAVSGSSLFLGNMGFFGKPAIPQPAIYSPSGTATRTFPADPSVAYTGITSGQAGSVYAQVADLESLRQVVHSLEGVVRQVVQDFGSTSGFGLLNCPT